MPSRPSRRSRIAAIAATADYNPEEAAVAQAMLERLPRDLEVIASDIKDVWGKGIEVEFEVGRLLSEARALFTEGGRRREGGDGGDKAFGRWAAEQHLPFGRHTAYNLRIGYEREAEVRALLAETSAQGRDLGVNTVVRLYLLAKPKPATSVPVAETTPVDPAFASLRDARTAILGWDGERTTHNAFGAMHVDDLRESALILKALLDAYNEARNARG